MFSTVLIISPLIASTFRNAFEHWIDIPPKWVTAGFSLRSSSWWGNPQPPDAVGDADNFVWNFHSSKKNNKINKKSHFWSRSHHIVKHFIETMSPQFKWKHPKITQNQIFPKRCFPRVLYVSSWVNLQCTNKGYPLQVCHSSVFWQCEAENPIMTLRSMHESFPVKAPTEENGPFPLIYCQSQRRVHGCILN